MTKYSNEFKVKAIKMVLKGASISHVAKNSKHARYSSSLQMDISL